MHTTREQWEQFKLDVIEKIKSLDYNEDPHLIVFMGNHDQQEQLSCACYHFRMTASECIRNAAINAERFDLGRPNRNN